MPIPLPALDIKAPEQPDILEQFARAQQLKSMIGAQQLQQQQATAMGQENQMRAQQIKSQQAIMRAYTEAEGDPDKTKTLAAKYGAMPQDLLKLDTAFLDRQTKIAGLQKDQLANYGAQAKAISDSAQRVLSAAPEDRSAIYSQERGRLLGAGIGDPSQMPEQYPGDDFVKLHAADAMAVQKQIAAVSTAQSQAVGAAATAEKTQLETKALRDFGGLSGAQLDAKAQFILQKQARGRQLSPDESSFLQAYKERKTMVPQFNFNLQSMAGVQPLTARQRDVAKAIAEGRQTMPSSFALRTPYWQTVMGGVYEMDPQFNEQRAQLRRSYTVGKQATEINAINTAMGHVGVMGDAIDALNNGDVRAMNAIANRLGVEVGKDPVTTFKTIVHRVGPELTRAYVGSAAGEGERQLTEKDFNPNLSPQQLMGNVKITSRLLRSKISSLENQWNQNKGEGMPSFEDQFIMPEARRALDKYSPQKTAGMIFARDPQGKLHQAPAGTPLPAGWKQEQR